MYASRCISGEARFREHSYERINDVRASALFLDALGGVIEYESI